MRVKILQQGHIRSWYLIEQSEHRYSTITYLAQKLHLDFSPALNLAHFGTHWHLEIDGFRLPADGPTFEFVRENDVVVICAQEEDSQVVANVVLKSKAKAIKSKRKVDDILGKSKEDAMDVDVVIPAVKTPSSDLSESSDAESEDKSSSSSSDASSTAESSSSEEESVPKVKEKESPNDLEKSSTEEKSDEEKREPQVQVIKIPNGLNRNKRQAVQRMIDMRGAHSRFDEIDQIEIEAQIIDTEMPESSSYNELSSNMIFSEVRLYDTTFRSKSAKKRERNQKYIEKVASYKFNNDVLDEKTADTLPVNAEPYLDDAPVENIPSPQNEKVLSKGARRRLRRAKQQAAMGNGSYNIFPEAIAQPIPEVMQETLNALELRKQELLGKFQNTFEDAELAQPKRKLQQMDGSQTQNGKLVTNLEKRPKPSNKLYHTLPALVGSPFAGMQISFQILEMSNAYTPEVSAHKVYTRLYQDATVLAYDPLLKTITLKLEPHSISQEAPEASDPWIKIKHKKPYEFEEEAELGRFELWNMDDVVYEENTTQQIITQQLADLIDVRVRS